MITMGQRWMARLREWIPGSKHTETPTVIFMNCWEWDRARRILPGRCACCNFLITSDEMKVKELTLRCNRSDCECQKKGPSLHKVCDLCDSMWRALYAGYGMKNRNYFREMDDKDKTDWDTFRRGQNNA